MTILLIILLALFTLTLIPVGVMIASDAGARRTWLLIAGVRVKAPTRAQDREKPPRQREPLSPQRVIGKIQSLGQAGRRIWAEHEGELPLRLWRTIQRFYRCFRFRVPRFNVIIAGPDPALTGMIYGAACAASSSVPRAIPLRLTADFTRETSQIDYTISLTIIPARLLLEAVRAFVTLHGWAMLRILRSTGRAASPRRSHG